MPFTKRDQLGPPKERKRRRLGESEGGRERREQWQAERDAHLQRHPSCQFWEVVGSWPGAPVECWGPKAVHHVVPRSMGGTRGPTGKKVTLCAGHHDYTEQFRLEAKERGLLVRREVGR